MLPVYQQLAARTGTGPARELARELMLWHDAMVRHERRLAAAGRGRAACTGDDCPHAEARGLWERSVQTFGPDADDLQYLRAAAGGASLPLRPAPEGRAASAAST